MQFIDDLVKRVEALGPHIERGAQRADDLACKNNALLEEIRDATQQLYSVEVYEYPKFQTSAADLKEIAGREGYVKIIRQIAIVGAGAVDVDIFMGQSDATGFVERVSLAAAGRVSRTLTLPTVEASPIYIQTSAAAQVNLIIQRIGL